MQTTTTTSSPPSSSPPPPPSTNEMDNDQINRIDTMDLRDIVINCDNENKFLSINQSTTKQEDENNNDKIDHGLIQVSCSSSDEELDTINKQISPTKKKNLFNPNIKSTTEQQQTSSFDHKSGEEDKQPTTNLSNDNDNISKR